MSLYSGLPANKVYSVIVYKRSQVTMSATVLCRRAREIITELEGAERDTLKEYEFKIKSYQMRIEQVEQWLETCMEGRSWSEVCQTPQMINKEKKSVSFLFL